MRQGEQVPGMLRAMRGGWLFLLFFCACRGGTALSEAEDVWLRVEGDAGVTLVLGGADCPTLSSAARVTMNGAPATVVQRGGKASACSGGCLDAVLQWPAPAPQMDFVVEDGPRHLRCAVDAAAPHFTFDAEAADGGVAHLALGAELPLRWTPPLPWEYLRVDVRNPALMWRGGRPIVLCAPGRCLPFERDAGVLVARVPAALMPGPTFFTAAARFPPRVERCEGASSCVVMRAATPAAASASVLVDP